MIALKAFRQLHGCCDSLVTYINLRSYCFKGTLPGSTGGLALLGYLNLYENFKPEGTIPTSFWSLTSTIVVYLNYNTLIGVIPTTVGGMKLLFPLALSFNEFGRFLPDEVTSWLESYQRVLEE